MAVLAVAHGCFVWIRGSLRCLLHWMYHPCLPPNQRLRYSCSFDRVEAEVAALRALSQADVAAFYRVGGTVYRAAV